MHDAVSLVAGEAVSHAAHAARRGDARALGEALRLCRSDTLLTFAAYERALPELRVPERAELNPPLWELGHIGWFQAHWIGRNPERHRGHRADPDAPRAAPLRADADALYDSSHVPHGTRWTLPLPGAAATRADLEAVLAQSLRCLTEATGGAEGGPGDDALYFHRLALLHEDMHHEAALYMAQSLGIAIDDARWQPRALPAAPPALTFEAARWWLGDEQPRGFVFDNEVGRSEVATPAFCIDAQVRRWADFLPFIEAGGYADRRWWSEAGWAWQQARAADRATEPNDGPRYTRRGAGGSAWEQWRHGRWLPLNPSEAARHLTHHEAEAWCRWAGRRLPSEAEWERAALTCPGAFAWGEVWEWTASAFAPFAGFAPHPYRDYSAPWFDGRPVLRGASFMTQPRMKHPRYRNFFGAHRNDVPAGFRTCAL